MYSVFTIWQAASALLAVGSASPVRRRSNRSDGFVVFPQVPVSISHVHVDGWRPDCPRVVRQDAPSGVDDLPVVLRVERRGHLFVRPVAVDQVLHVILQSVAAIGLDLFPGFAGGIFERLLVRFAFEHRRKHLVAGFFSERDAKRGEERSFTHLLPVVIGHRVRSARVLITRFK